MKVRTRFAPSPTGYLHIGGARTALFNWLYARKHKGEYVLRIEDTDKERSKSEFTEDIFSSLSWLGINSDIEPVYQSKRSDKYQAVIQKLLEENNAYRCYCSKERLGALREEQISKKLKPRYDGKCRDLNQSLQSSESSVVRLKNPLLGNVQINDEIRGKVIVQNSELDDLILARSDGSPTYHLTVVVDDFDLNITHVIRGDDHLNNTFRQHNIFLALGKEPPIYAHIPLIHGTDGKRLSKRHGAVSVNQYREEGILATGLLNYLVRLGWSHGDQELFSVKEMIEHFDLASIQQSAATFDDDKLQWVNQQHMKNISGSDLGNILDEYFTGHGYKYDGQPDLYRLYDAMKDRSKTLQELCHNSQFLYQDIELYNEKAAKKNFTQDKVEVLTTLKTQLSNIDNWTADNIHAEIKSTAEAMNLKMGEVAPPLRLAVTGGADSPSIDLTLELLGEKKTTQRIDRAIGYIVSTI
ncbi:MAG: glutamate--tRNA ligase [Gammaproteobacteria bacterium]|nr:MAG: glutamate--tRNA ligase [Gammaproteobacteria bacterium]